MDLKEREQIAQEMSNQAGIPVKPEHVTKLPDDGSRGHMGVEHWEVYAARAGEFTVILTEYDNGDVIVSVV